MLAVILAYRHGQRFKGVYNMYDKKLHLFTPGKARRSEEGIMINDLSDPLLDDLLESQAMNCATKSLFWKERLILLNLKNI